MCIRLLNRSTRAELWFAVLLALYGPAAPGLESDRDQPIEIEADTGELDDVKNISVYEGDVITTQGTIRMTGDRMTVYYTDDDELDYLIMEGRPATYRQLPDDSSVYDYAEALTMKYYEQREYVILTDKALVTQEGLRFSGDRIEYDTRLSQVKAWSNRTEVGAGPDGPEQDKKDRVKIIIRKKEDRCDDREYEQSLDPAQLKIFRQECEKKKTEKEE